MSAAARPETSSDGGAASRHRRGARGRRTQLRRLVGVAVLAVALAYLSTVVEGPALADAGRALLSNPLGLTVALVCYAAAFWLRSRAWQRVLPGLSAGQSWAALHVSLLGNHVLPFRLGEALRVTSVLRRTGLPAAAVISSAVAMRLADLVAVAVLALVSAPALLLQLVGPSALLAVLTVLAVALLGSMLAVRQLSRRAENVRLPGAGAAVAAVSAWLLEAVVVWQVAAGAGLALSPAEAVAVTAVTIAAQTVAVTPGGFGSYEAAATAALVALGAPPGPAAAVALLTHAVKTVYSLVVGLVALFLPAPGYWGRFRLPAGTPPRPARSRVAADAPVVVFLPAHNEAEAIGAVLHRLPPRVCGRHREVLVIDDGSTDRTADVAAAAGATVLAQPRNLGLGAAVRRGLAEASTRCPAAVVYLDADGEYPPEEIDSLAAPVLDGTADYVIGSRFAGRIDRMLPHRRVGNVVLTRLLRWVARRPDITDGQSGYRAFSPDAARAAEIIHDYNYAQVLTLDLLAKGFRYAEVPISYRFRETGSSFVRLGRYLRKVLPAMHRELNSPLPAAHEQQPGGGPSARQEDLPSYGMSAELTP
ncbi:MAG: lysylphosphatidylglycerol synthase domain-containing protein [Actinomycetota bacterium]|nr:lysylphosphatidylglycerol synthase domain-containing protein [Actinomycetota bacterium]